MEKKKKGFIGGIKFTILRVVCTCCMYFIFDENVRTNRNAFTVFSHRMCLSYDMCFVRYSS